MNLLGISVSVLVFRGRGESCRLLLMRRRSESGGFWQSVSGKIEPGETAPRAAAREVAEETGLDVLALFPVDYVNSYYEPRRDAVCVEPFFAAEVGEGEVVRTPEHTDHAWKSVDGARQTFELPSHRRALEAFAERLPDPAYLSQPLSL